jgi:hypothetical protein
MKEELASEKTIRTKAITSFVIFFLLLAAGAYTWIWIKKER